MKKDYSPTTMYNDYAINETLFHWQSQASTRVDSKTAQRYINHKKYGSNNPSFCKDKQKDQFFSSTLLFLGTGGIRKVMKVKNLSVLYGN